MTTKLKEMDGARSTEIEHKDGVVYFDGGSPNYCFAFDAALLLRAIERELGVFVTRHNYAMSGAPGKGVASV